MAQTYHLQVVAQDRTVFDGAVTSIIAPGEQGYLGILRDHAPLLTTLGEGFLTVETAPNEMRVWKVRGGFLEALDNEVTLLVDEAEEAPVAAPAA